MHIKLQLLSDQQCYFGLTTFNKKNKTVFFIRLLEIMTLVVNTCGQREIKGLSIIHHALGYLLTGKTRGMFNMRHSGLDLFLAPCLMSVIWMSAARLPLGSLTTI